MGAEQLDLAVIVPLHNETESIDYFYTRLKSSLEGIEDLTAWEVFFVNDGSTDNSLEKLKAIMKQDNRVNIISLSRSFGYQSALIAGLKTVTAKFYSIIDVDCEDPPELLEKFYYSIKHEDTEIAYGIRSNREEPSWIVFCRKMFYKINRIIADNEIVMWMAEFSMFTHNAKLAILSPRNTYSFLRSEMAYVGLKRKGFDYFRAKRKFGKTHYNFYKMAMFAIAGFLTSSTFPLRLILYLGCFIASILPLIWILFGIGFETIANVSIVILLYYSIICLSTISLYLARSYQNIINRPVYVIDTKRTFLNNKVEQGE